MHLYIIDDHNGTSASSLGSEVVSAIVGNVDDMNRLVLWDQLHVCLLSKYPQTDEHHLLDT